MKPKIIILAILTLAAVLRLYQLDRYPWGLNADEAAIGYNAYSLLETGKDEHGVSWPLTFRSFDDYKPPVYFYLALPFVKLLGLTVTAVRLPSALLGIASVYLLYLLSRQLKFSLSHSLIAACLLAISPWHLQFSRGGWEVNAGTFFLILGLWAFYCSLSRPKYFILWTLSFVAALYTYHSLRLIAPLLGLYLLISHHRQLSWRPLLFSLVLGGLLLIPFALQTVSGSAASRFSGVSIFADAGPLNRANQLRGQHTNPQSLLPRLLHNQYFYYAQRLFDNLSKHYSDPFLFFTGDEIGRSRVPDFGQSYTWTLPFFAFGLWWLAKGLNRNTGLVLFWFLIGALPAALTFQSPHALRAQNLALPLQLIIAAGLVQTATWARRYQKALTALIIAIGLLGLARYLNAYYLRYPQELGYAWQPGFNQLGEYLRHNASGYDQVIVSTRYDQPYILTAFFLKYPPRQLQAELVFSSPDRFGFATGLQFGRYRFHPITPTDFDLKNALIVAADEATPVSTHPIYVINYPNGTPVFRFYSTKP